MLIQKKLRKILHIPAKIMKKSYKAVFYRKFDVDEKVSALEKRIRGLEAEQEKLCNLLYSSMDPDFYPLAIKQWYQDKTGKILDLDKPRTFNEKIQWLKLYDNDPRKTTLSDKYMVRDWIKEKIGEEYLINLIAVFDKAEQIDFDILPDSFIIKPNHASAMYCIVKDKNQEDLEKIRQQAAGWLEVNYAFANGFELQYNNIPRKLLVEEYHENGNDRLKDYKFWCFDGKCRFINYIIDRNKGTRSGLYDQEWNRLPFTPGAFTPIQEKIPMPEQIPQMIKIAETLAEGFAHVRVDLYLLDDGSIKFGEMTFTTSSGLCNWKPSEANLWVGDMLSLPDKK